jgi:DNA polymerase-3 subunit alpha
MSIFEVAENKSTTNSLSSIQFDVFPEIPEYPSKVLLAMEKEMLGLYISGHPLSEFESEINSHVSFFTSQIDLDITQNDEETMEQLKDLSDGMQVTVGGLVGGKKTKTTKSNKMMAFFNLEDMFGTIEVIVFPTVLSKYSQLLDEDNIVLVRGRLSIKEDEKPKIICDEVRPLKHENNEVRVNKRGIPDLEGIKAPKARRVQLTIPNSKRTREFTFALDALLKYFSGNVDVYLMDEEGKPIVVKVGGYRVNINDSLIQELQVRLGSANVKIS